MKSWNWTAPKRSLIQKLSRDLVLIKCRSPIYVQSAQRLSNSPKAILDSSDALYARAKLLACPIITAHACHPGDVGWITAVASRCAGTRRRQNLRLTDRRCH